MLRRVQMWAVMFGMIGAIVSPVVVQARGNDNQNRPGEHTQSTESPRPSSSPRDNDHEEHHGDKARLCEQVGDRMSEHHHNVRDKAESIIDRFDRRVDKIKTFVTDNNLTVPNYDALLQDISTEKANTQQALDALKTAIAAFHCTDSNRRDEAAAIRAAAGDFKVAAKKYRQAVRALLEAVKAVAPTPTPEPSVSVSPEAAH